MKEVETLENTGTVLLGNGVFWILYYNVESLVQLDANWFSPHSKWVSEVDGFHYYFIIIRKILPCQRLSKTQLEDNESGTISRDSTFLWTPRTHANDSGAYCEDQSCSYRENILSSLRYLIFSHPVITKVFGTVYVIKMQDHFQVSTLKKDIMLLLSLKAESSFWHDRKKGNVDGATMYLQNAFDLFVQSKIRSQNKPRGKERSKVSKIAPIPPFHQISYSDSLILNI